MANTLGNYDPIFYANEALIELEKALGMAGRVHLGYDEERRSFRRGSVVSISRPSTFVVNDAPSTAQDLAPDTVNVTLDQWKEVKFKLNDKELAYSGERIVNDHIRPMAYALADNVDQALNAEANNIPWNHLLGATAAATDLTASKRIMFDNNVPMIEGMIHGEMGGQLDSQLQDLAQFTQWQGSGPAGAEAQRRGQVGFRYGTEWFANQNVITHTSGTASVTALALNGAHSAGATSIAMDAASVTGTVVAGDSFVIAGSTQRYVVTATATAATNAFASVSIFPALTQAYSDNAVITLYQHGAGGSTVNRNLMFHRNAFALVTAPLSEMGNELGAKIATVSDPITGLSLRSRLYYVGSNSEVHVALDLLYGVKTLDANLAVTMDQP